MNAHVCCTQNEDHGHGIKWTPWKVTIGIFILHQMYAVYEMTFAMVT